MALFIIVNVQTLQASYASFLVSTFYCDFVVTVMLDLVLSLLLYISLDVYVMISLC